MHWISVLLGFVIGWAIVFFIGPRKRVSYYVQAPVVGMPISELDTAMEAVGLAPSKLPEKSVADIAAAKQSPPAPNMVRPPMMAPAPTIVRAPVMVLAGQGTPATPQVSSPSPVPAPVLQ